jgi:hypothetical protein
LGGLPHEEYREVLRTILDGVLAQVDTPQIANPDGVKLVR